MESTRKAFYILSFLIVTANVCLTEKLFAEDEKKAELFAGQDLYLEGQAVLSSQINPDEYSLVFPKGFSMSIGGNKYCSDNSVIWIKQISSIYAGQNESEIKATVYLEGDLKIKKSSFGQTVPANETILEKDKIMVVILTTSGEIFITADDQQSADVRQLDIYKKANAAVSSLSQGPKFVVRPESLVPQEPECQPQIAEKPKQEAPAEVKKPVEQKPQTAEETKIHYRYPVNLAPAGEESPKIEKFSLSDGTQVATVIGRIYVWQKQQGDKLLELQADNAVVFYTNNKVESDKKSEGILAGGSIQSIYMSGDVILTEGPRTIRATEVYYDFANKRASINNSVMRTFDEQRGIPIYVRAANLRQMSANKFAAENVTVTTSEFCKPQISLKVAHAEISDEPEVKDEETGEFKKHNFDAQMCDVRLKAGDCTLLRIPRMRSNLERPDLPISAIQFGNSGIWGTSLETEWYLSRLLGLREPEGTKSRLDLDYYSKRGLGVGAHIDYEQENCFGHVLGYIINDHGEDRLGRIDQRRDLKPPEDLRGRFQVQHRQFLPYNWQATTEIDYLSDEHFLESYFRREFGLAKKPETLVELKRLEDNWAFSVMGKARINDFEDQVEEMPTIQYHRTGESLFDDNFTLYSDTGLSRLRQLIGKDNNFAVSQEEYEFVSHRTELDLPLRLNDSTKFVPYIAGTFGYDDRSGFQRSLVDGSDIGPAGEDELWIGETGARLGTQFWKVYPQAKSRLWDVNSLRHIISPEATGVFYAQSDSAVAEEHDMLNLGLTQRLQTKRGPKGKERTIDWMRLNTEFTFVDDPEPASTARPDRFVWNRPMIPLRVFSTPEIFNDDLDSGLDLQTVESFGPGRNYFGMDYIWRISDTFAVLTDGYYDMQLGVFEQYDFGVSRLLWPNLSYYIGTRYLRNVHILDENGSNAFIFSMTYEIDPRYTLILTEQYDFDYEANIRSEISLIRKYHRLFYGLTFSADASLDDKSVVFNIWPQGVPELGLGPRYK